MLQYSMRMDWARALLESEAAKRRDAVEIDLRKREFMYVPHGANQRERLSSRDDSKMRNEWKWKRCLSLEMRGGVGEVVDVKEERAAWIEGKGYEPRAFECNQTYHSWEKIKSEICEKCRKECVVEVLGEKLIGC